MPNDALNLVTLTQDDRFRDPLAAAEWLESVRWPDGNVCPKCGESERKPYKLPHKTRRLWKCAACRKQYTVTVGTIFESSHVGLDKWLLAFYLLCSSKKGMSAHQLHRSLGVTYKTAWSMFHRVREAMRDPAFTSRLTGTIEADETYIGGVRKGGTGRPGPKDRNKAAVFSLVERGGRARSFHVAHVTAEEPQGALQRHVQRDSSIMADEWRFYRGLDRDFASHEAVSHGQGEYVRGAVHTNTVEGYVATLKRGVNGTYHRISPGHLHRYLNEFDFRYNPRGATDGGRMIATLKQAEGKRLEYREAGRS